MTNRDDRLMRDVLVIGSGIAGCSTALALARYGLQVTLITNAFEPEESNTKYAQGGIIAEGIDDSPGLLASDIASAGAGLCNPEAVRVFAAGGPRLVKEFLVDEVGVEFSRDQTGALDLTMEAAHSTRRIVHADDATGKAIELALIKKVCGDGRIEILPGHTAIDLITNTHHSSNPLAIYESSRVLGAYVLDRANKRVRTILAPYTILATGGIGRIYLHTTNPECARGDGIAMAYRAGAQVINAEYIQFHPTAFYHENAERFLITESVRGEGGKLVTRGGRPFMKDYDSELEDLAPRDVVARAIHEEMIKNNVEYVLLDIASYANSEVDIAKRFPTIYEQCLQYGVDMTREPIPVVPAAHYFCGGVKCDTWGRTNLDGLYAVGEVSCTGLHGANRLASTSLLEGLVWGFRAARHIKEREPADISRQAAEIPPWVEEGLDEEVDPALILEDWMVVRTTMWNYAGIVRTGKRLARARADLEYLRHRIEDFYKRTKLTDEIIGLRNGIVVAILVVNASLRNTISRGCHFRKDSRPH